MSVENITSNILKDAENLAAASLKNAEEEKQNIINEAKKKAETIINIEKEKAEKEAESLKSRKVSAAELEGRKMVLAAKQDAIKKSFDMAIDRLKNMEEEDYINFLLNQIVNIPYTEGAIILNKRDRERIGQKLVKAVNEKLKAEKFILSDETVNASGGFILKSGAIMINSSFETVIDSVKDELTNDIASKLF
ncbi:MAG: hypothetical protein GX339_06385 [Tissierellia bacterium]|nr:hypothetical protein [Tissierellia bacterium]